MNYEWTEERREKARLRGIQMYQDNPERFIVALKGIPKSEEQKRKMRAAKLGVPKSEEHKAAMVAAHHLRHAVIDAIMETQGLDYKPAVKELKTNKAHYYQWYKEVYEAG